MQDLKTVKAQHAPTIIGTKDLEFELLVREARKRHAKEDKDAIRYFNQGEIALDNAAANGDESEVIQANGRIITGNRARHNKYATTHEEKDPHGIKALIKVLAAAEVAQQAIDTWLKGITATLPYSGTNMKTSFAAKTKDLLTNVVYDENFIYGGEEVSVRTADLFQKRLERILNAQKKMLDAKTKDEYLEALDSYTRLVDRSKAIVHPDVGVTFDSKKVARVNQVVDSKDGATCGIVPTYRDRATCTIDGRKMKINVGDQYDQNPTETIGEVKQGQAPAIPIAIPTFEIS